MASVSGGAAPPANFDKGRKCERQKRKSSIIRKPSILLVTSQLILTPRIELKNTQLRTVNDRAGSVCLNRKPGLVSGASAGFRLPRSAEAS
jgi:hypothetical protein